MNKLTRAISILSVSAVLTGCNTFNTGVLGNSVVGAGVGIATAGTYATVDTLDAGWGIATSPLYRHGHTYKLHNGRYVRVD